MTTTIFFIISIFASIILNNVLIKFSKNLGMRNIDESAVRWASKTKPALGGISFYIIFMFVFLINSIFFNSNDLGFKAQSIGIVLAVTLGFFLGLSDDAYNTRPLLKFLTQITCGVILVITGTQIHFFPYQPLNVLVTIFWVVAIMNSINMLDNMDGIAGVTSVFISLMIIFMSVFTHCVSQADYFIMISVTASICGFLFFNIYPSKIYMGDTGSQFLGVYLSAYSIKYVWDCPSSYESFINPFILLIVFLLPIVDTTTVTINRLRKGRSPFIGGRDHTTHHLYFKGLSERKVFLVFSIVSIFSIAIIYIFCHWMLTNHLLIISISITYALFIFLLLYLPTIIVSKK